jgi:hypothetical protein
VLDPAGNGTGGREAPGKRFANKLETGDDMHTDPEPSWNRSLLCIAVGALGPVRRRSGPAGALRRLEASACLLLLLALTACAGGSVSSGNGGFRSCDRNGTEEQRRAC